MADWQLFLGDALAVLGTIGATIAVAATVAVRDVRGKIQAASACGAIGTTVLLGATLAAGDGASVTRALVAAALVIMGGAASAQALLGLVRGNTKHGKQNGRRREVSGRPAS